MSKKVVIEISGLMDLNNNDEKDRMKLVTKGKFAKRGENYYLSYNETEMTGLEGVTTTIKINERYVKVKRFGKLNSEMLFEKNKRNICNYVAPFGALTIGINTNKLMYNINENGGNIHIKYDLDFNNEVAGSNELKVDFTEENSCTI